MPGVAIVASSPHLRGELVAGFGPGGEINIVLQAPGLAEARALGFGGAQVALVDAGSVGDEPIGADDSGPPLVLLVGDGIDPREDRREGASLLRADVPIEQLVAAVHAAAAGLRVFSPLFADRLSAAPSLPPPYEPLTPREHEVLRQMSFGLGNREIAAALHISPHTAKFHVAQVIAKLDASSRAHAVANALRAGLVAEAA